MPRKKTTYTIFISAPSDVSADVELVKSIVSDINLISHSLGLNFEYFYWLDDVTPGASENAQDRINDQSEGYDIIISIFGSTLGTPTLNYDSGTVEEIERSLANVSELTFGDDSIMVFFKKVQIDAMYGNLEEASRVQKFRKSISKRVLYKEFEDDADIREKILKAFSKILLKHNDASSQDAAIVVDSDKEIIVNDGIIISNFHVEDDVDGEDFGGLLDAVASFQRAMERSTSSADNIGSAITGMGSVMSRVTAEMGEPGRSSDISYVARSIKDISKAMDHASDTLEVESDIMVSSFDSALESLAAAIEIGREDFGNQEDDLEDLKHSAKTLNDNILSSMSQMSEFRNVLSQLPRIDKGFGKSRIRLLKAIDALYSAMNSVLNKSSEMQAIIVG